MNKDEQERKKFLEDQLQWCKEQDTILEEIEFKLYKMREIAEYALKHDLSKIEKDQLNHQLNKLKKEVHSLEKMLQTVFH
ncbi:hypothetical protein [Schinkia azotoformans]|uniref:hypothetical protein n=1 Tax=Schinkia azotoformans TaxID=1454 RepID=UPI002DB68745|nr:hypothetical protein [Schinkia azotoformans]MEC1770233.1 hypothetical protein [Schinkia azotoformans]MED4365675.1 hypothetical protein [Schinkia azotoformans]